MDASRGWMLSVALAGLLVCACRVSQGQQQAVAPIRQAPPTPHAKSGAGEVVYTYELARNPSATISIRYLSPNGMAPSCILEITENRVVIARNSRLVECGLLPSREMVDVEISGSPNNLTVFQQKTKGTNKYTLQRTDSGRWVITNVEVVYPRDNVAAGDVEVVRATADLKFTPVLVNQYSPASIKERMVQSIVQ